MDFVYKSVFYVDFHVSFSTTGTEAKEHELSSVIITEDSENREKKLSHIIIHIHNSPKLATLSLAR